MANARTHKVCSLCFVDKPISDFSPHSSQAGVRSACKPCSVKVVQNYKTRNPMYELGYRLKKKFDMSLDEYFDRLEKQGGKCAICRVRFSDAKRRRLCVDHDHSTGWIRGLLCFNCNTVLGKVQDDKDTLADMITYLENHDKEYITSGK